MRKVAVSLVVALAALGCSTNGSGGPGPADASDGSPSDDGSAEGGRTDATADGDANVECPRGAPSVPCGTIACEGATPVCCQKDTAVLCVATSCPTFSDADPTPYGVAESHCDDSKDCTSGTFCCASYDKGLSRPIRACRTVAGIVQCIAFVCHEDCDCPTGSCVQGQCS